MKGKTILSLPSQCERAIIYFFVPVDKGRHAHRTDAFRSREYSCQRVVPISKVPILQKRSQFHELSQFTILTRWCSLGFLDQGFSEHSV